jgi:hypothetical protein
VRSNSCVDVGLEAELVGDNNIGVAGSGLKSQDATPAASSVESVSDSISLVSNRLSIS